MRAREHLNLQQFIINMSRVTLRQISERVGCSRSAVSYALRNDPSISTDLRRKVAKVAAELGWVPDSNLAKQMAIVRGNLGQVDVPNIAIVINCSREGLKEGHAARMQYEGALNHAKKHGLNMSVFNLGDEPLSAKRLKGIFKARGIQGVVFIATINPALPIEYLEIGRDFACSVSGLRFPELPFHVAIGDFLEAGRISLQMMLESGYKRPAIIIQRGVDEPLAWAFAGGVTTGMMQLEPENRIPIYHVGEDELGIGEHHLPGIKKLFKDNKPDCCLTLDPRGLRTLMDEHFDDDEEVPLFSLDWQPDQIVDGGIDQRHTSIGEAAVDLVMGQIRRGEFGIPQVHRSVHIEGEWVDVSCSAQIAKAG
ncbi:LacI family DNA-binding transcriptional regulator [Pelagicoccus mobilis]|uniref:LacI family DNA-binding transcriptional regulator n=1 Tax=Pelagicoccus mobilis TaxID=415221 RepID=A0A934RYK5_9BACT|nr:LacI family DNA-binding transcriptional regulator [Pelagicoccus mobilis]MBK1878728.1 LacI family DNA-binding transcriptional regulator [Pelagicoccus mobilis]